MNILAGEFRQCLLNAEKPLTKIVFLCIGTDRSTGDSYGPIVGSLLEKIIVNNNIEIKGTLHNPVHATNIQDALKSIDTRNNLFIVVDASLGKNVGKIIIDNKPIKPGNALGKKIPPIGDISIKGVVNHSTGADFLVIQNTRLSFVYDLAIKTVNSLEYVLKEVSSNKSISKSY